MRIPGLTSTGSKRPEVLFGCPDADPRAMSRAEGCRVWDEFGKEYTDMVMALGAVALGYAHPGVVAAVERAARNGCVGSLPPVLEGEVAERICSVIPCAESVRFLKTGAEAAAAAVRIARVHSGRESVITCGYHGWLDWCQDEAGVPESVKELRRTIPFNDVAALTRAFEEPHSIAAVVVEPVIDDPPDPAWLQALRDVTARSGAVLIFDEVKTAFRVALGGAAERFGAAPDMVVIGKALGNGLPIAAVCGAEDLMEAATRTWISSTLATEYVSLSAALAVLEAYEREDVVGHLGRVGARFKAGLEELARRHRGVVRGVRGLPEMCYLDFRDDETSGSVALHAARRGVLFKRTAYNFVSLAHTEQVVDEVLDHLDRCLTLCYSDQPPAR